VDPELGEEPFDDAGALVRRRRMTALAALGLVFALAIIVPLVVFDDGGSPVAQTTPLTTSPPTTPTTTTTERPATTTTQTTPAQGAALRITLPDSGSLRRGDRGDEVEKLQRALAALGFAAGEPDGVFGQVTQAAVVDFQQSNNLDPDGVVGPDTVRLLNTALARRGITAAEAGAG
jgi:peptidoglycan hydrolase-like protein with peptidoglycan-binding domain